MPLKGSQQCLLKRCGRQTLPCQLLLCSKAERLSPVSSQVRPSPSTNPGTVGLTRWQKLRSYMDQGRASVDVTASRGPTLEGNTRCSFREDSSRGPSSTPRHRRGVPAAYVPHSSLDLEKVTHSHLSRSPQHLPVGKSSKLPRMSSSGRNNKTPRPGERPHGHAQTLAQSGCIAGRRSKRSFGTVCSEARQLGFDEKERAQKDDDTVKRSPDRVLSTPQQARWTGSSPGGSTPPRRAPTLRGTHLTARVR